MSVICPVCVNNPDIPKEDWGYMGKCSNIVLDNGCVRHICECTKHDHYSMDFTVNPCKRGRTGCTQEVSEEEYRSILKSCRVSKKLVDEFITQAQGISKFTVNQACARCKNKQCDKAIKYTHSYLFVSDEDLKTIDSRELFHEHDKYRWHSILRKHRGRKNKECCSVKS